MAKKKVQTKKLIQQKISLKKPPTNSKKAVDEIVRVRNNEQARLRRLEAKFAAIPKKQKGKADKIRKEIKAQQKAVDSIKSTVKDIRSYATTLKSVQADKKSLKLKNAALNKKLEKLYGSKAKNVASEYAKLNKEHIKNSGLIADKESKLRELLYKVNKELGFDPGEIAKRIGISEKELEKKFSDDFPDDYFEEGGEGYEGEGGGGDFGGGGGPAEPDEEIEEEEQEEDGFIEEYSDVFWQVWKDFDSNEKPRISNYKHVIFKFGGHSYKFNGGSISLISMRAGEMWRFARENGSDTYVVKSVSASGDILKYEIDEF